MTESATTARALELWGLEGAQCALVAARENRVFRVDHCGRRVALRLHRPGYRSDAELRSELQWLEAVAAGGLAVPRPVASRSGELLHRIDGHQADVVSWLPGAPLGATGVPLDLPDRAGTFYALGREMARLHDVSDGWERPSGFTRISWDRDGLLCAAPVWGRFWDNPTLSASDREMLKAFRHAADSELTAREGELDFGLIHADLVRENVMVDGDRIQLIDFDDGGFGYRLFDIATTLGKMLTEPDFEGLKAALLDGYRAVRPIDTNLLDLFMALRAASYVGWIVSRMEEDGAVERNARFVRTAVEMAQNWLSQGTEATGRRS